MFTLLVLWEDDNLGVLREIDDLKHIFGYTYRSDAETWAITSTKNRYQGRVDKVQLTLIEFDTDENLFILYCGGHARMNDRQSQPTWVSESTSCTSNSKSHPPNAICSTRMGGLTFHSCAFLNLLEEIDLGVLLLFDSCQAVPQAFDSRGKRVVSAITSTGFEPGAIRVAAQVGMHSFTHLLSQVLETLSIPLDTSRNCVSLSDVYLHSLLVTELRKWKDGLFKRDRHGNPLLAHFRRRTPIHQFLSRNKHARPISLCPLEHDTDARLRASYVADSGLDTDESPDQEPRTKPWVPEVLIGVRLKPDTFEDADVNDSAKWLPGYARECSASQS